jgi:hypothetical protein
MKQGPFANNNDVCLCVRHCTELYCTGMNFYCTYMSALGGRKEWGPLSVDAPSTVRRTRSCTVPVDHNSHDVMCMEHIIDDEVVWPLA